MNIDQRIERLTERHEALAQSVELLTADVRELSTAVATTNTQVSAIGIALHELIKIVTIHETRIGRLEA